MCIKLKIILDHASLTEASYKCIIRTLYFFRNKWQPITIQGSITRLSEGVVSVVSEVIDIGKTPQFKTSRDNSDGRKCQWCPHSRVAHFTKRL